MAAPLSDAEIADLLAEPKPLATDWRERLRTKPKSGHHERELDIIGAAGSEFRLILRQSQLNHLDFSAILAYIRPDGGPRFRLRRHNGRSHEHKNVLEGDVIYGFHIHTATERYQTGSGLREDGYAEPTDAYADLTGAVRHMIASCGFDVPIDPQATLFVEES